MSWTLAAGCGGEQPRSFSRDVMPILEAACLPCHQRGGAGHAASGFSVESYDSVMKGTRLGPVVDPGFSFASTLQILIEHKADPSINMPMDRPQLSPDKIQVIGEWIDQGARNN